MKKLKLDLAELRVESFDTRDGGGARQGTVFGLDCTHEPSCGGTCDESCGGTCQWQWTCWGSQAPMECCA